MTFYAIRHRPTGWYLPERERRRGYTFDEPSGDKPPRLFTKESAARNALIWWLRGQCYVNGRYDENGEYDERWHLRPVEGRRPDEMEVVPVEITITN